MMSKFKFLMSSLWLFLKPVIEVFMSALGVALAKAAADAVFKAAGLPPQTANTERQRVAYNNVVRAMRTQGYDIEDPTNALRESLINTAIELALQDFKAKQQ